MSQIKIVGVGGVGTHLVVPLCRYIVYSGKKMEVVLFDGDRFEPENEDRQDFLTFGNKAEITAKRLKKLFPDLNVKAKDWYITGENIFLCIKEKDIIFCCVDNHNSRNLLSDFCQKLKDVVLISGGNEYSDGNVQLYVRKNGKDVTLPITYLHPEISKPKDRNPAELSCEELAKLSVPQLIFANFMVAAWMLGTFWIIDSNQKDINYSELYFDLKIGNARSVKREK